MNTPWDIVCFAGVDWDSHRQRPQWLMQGFADRGASVLYVDNLGTRLPRISDARRVAHRVSRWARSSWTPTTERPGGAGRILRDAPVVLPLQHLALVRAFGRWTLLHRLRRRVGGGRPLVVWTYLPMPVIRDAAAGLGADLLVYDWSDDASAHVLTASPAVRRRIAGWETAMAKAADLVFVASAELLRRRGGGNPETHLIPHGAPDSPRSTTRVPHAVDRLPHPRIGFVGSITEWTDVGLVEELAASRPDWSFVLVGPVRTRVNGLRARDNVLLTGERPHEEIPALLRAFDAGIIPYRVTPATTAASPVKLREYLAHGLPVVSVDVPEVRPFAPPVRLATGADAFAEALAEALAEGRRPPGRGAPTWDERVDEMAAHVARALERAR